jgi:hypothetical protein
MWFLIVVLLAVPSFASCPNGSIDHDGLCAAMPAPQGGAESVKPSDEKAPDDKMPSYERAGIKADMGKPGIEPSADVAHDYKSENSQQ